MSAFARKVNLQQRGQSYAVVAIMGPQSSGKSTLLNHLFRTKFRMMDEYEGRSQTTLGIWMARCPDIEPLTLVMDMEGSDGSERGEDDTAFEKQIALFALAVADVVLINLWCHDIGREHAACKPLLRAVFQQVMIRFCDKPRKITLMFVIRDKTKSPEQKLEAILRRDIEKIWASIEQTSGSTNIQLSDIFKVEVVFLPNYEEREEDFKEKVKDLKQRFVHSTAPGGLADASHGKEPASGFSISAHNIWKTVKENKDLNLPAHKILVANLRCEEIRNEQLVSFEMSEDWCNLCKNAQFGFINGFGKIIDSILNNYVSKYDAEAIYFDEAVKTAKRKELIDNLLQLVKPVYQAMLNQLRLEHLNKFMEAFDRHLAKDNNFGKAAADCIKNFLLEFDNRCEDVKIELATWDNLKARAKIQHDMNSYIAVKREDKLASKISRHFEPKLKHELSDSVGYLLCEETDPTWSKIRNHFKKVMESNLPTIDGLLSEFGTDEEGKKEKTQRIVEYAKDVVEAKAREESGRAMNHMTRKFMMHFQRNWNSHAEIDQAASSALYIPVKLLAGLVAIRLEEGRADNIEHILSSALGGTNTPNPLDSPFWNEVPSSKTLITPIQCKQLWEAYKSSTGNSINQAHRDLQAKLDQQSRVRVSAPRRRCNVL
ncbi:hypothetical protein L6164_003012 [Bauhinia variegata]|uniref:Uncharacterized protein n=1 Tax=Bauhinia variegata TaxID=167791 RepID=A0ACB9PZY6_BAUVA|nr:hypothetical protein L6164_003012 [Bauhinia variegata]